MSEITKNNQETNPKDVESTKLGGELKSIQTEQKKKSLLTKISDFFNKKAIKESEYPKSTQDDKNKNPREQAIESFTDESGRVHGSIDEHRREEERITSNRASDEAGSENGSLKSDKSLRQRAIDELATGDGYVKGGSFEIEQKMREIEERDSK